MSNQQLKTLFNKPISSKLKEFDVDITIETTSDDGKKMM